MKSLALVVLTTLTALAVVHWLVVEEGVAEPLVPGPERVVESFLAGLGGRPQQALTTLADGLRTRTTLADLQLIDRIMRERYGSYSLQPGGQRSDNGAGLKYIATIRTGKGAPLRSEFRLQRDPRTGLWKITSFIGLAELTAIPRPKVVRETVIQI